MKIYIYTNFKCIHFILFLHVKLLSINTDFEIESVDNLDNLNISKDIIIPFDIQPQYELFKYFYHDNIYETIDNKQNFYFYIQSNPDLLDNNIYFVPT